MIVLSANGLAKQYNKEKISLHVVLPSLIVNDDLAKRIRWALIETAILE